MNHSKRHPPARNWLLAAVATLLVVLCPAASQAQSGPDTMNSQGRLLDSGGNPRGGEAHCLRFRICSDSDCTTQVWPSSGYEEHAVTTESGTYKAGLFSVALGTTSPIPPALMYDYDGLYLEIGVADETTCPGTNWSTMDPPSPLRANAYAQRSRRVRTTEGDDAYLVDVRNSGPGGATHAIYAENRSTGNYAAAGRFQAYGTTGTTYGLEVRNYSTSSFAVAGYFVAEGDSGRTYLYLLEDVDVYGQATAHGPVPGQLPYATVYLPLVVKGP